MIRRMKIPPFLRAAVIFLSLLPEVSFAQDPNYTEILKRLEKLEQKQVSLDRELKAKDVRIQELEGRLSGTHADVAPLSGSQASHPDPESGMPDAKAAETSPPKKKLKERLAALAEHKPYSGAKLFSAKWVDLNFTPYAYVRYLNQMGIDETRTDSLGRSSTVRRQNSVQLGKVMLQFKGWLGDEKFRYYLYSWTSNASMGEGAQVVVGGNLSYLFDQHFNLGGGIAALPSTRSTRGTFPFWNRVDARPMADEYFRASYTTGFYAWGDIIDNLHYKTMIGNNLSQLGVSQAQLDEGFNTIASSLWWTSDGFGAYEGMGDFEHHEKPAFTLGSGYTFSRESDQNQPGTNDPENTQLRLSDGRAIFDEGALAPGVQVDNASYHMATTDAGIKYRGFELSGDYFFRWLNNLDATGPLPQDSFFDHGFQIHASQMVVKRLLQVYGFGSTIFGEFGKPWEIGGGLNYFPLKSKGLRVNLETEYVHESPVGYTAYPMPVGANGVIFMTNIETHY